jgi:hypothetical protein
VIDELWLRDLRVSGPEGDIVGLLGVGSEWVVFECLKPSGVVRHFPASTGEVPVSSRV